MKDLVGKKYSNFQLTLELIPKENLSEYLA